MHNLRFTQTRLLFRVQWVPARIAGLGVADDRLLEIKGSGNRNPACQQSAAEIHDLGKTVEHGPRQNLNIGLLSSVDSSRRTDIIA